MPFPKPSELPSPVLMQEIEDLTMYISSALGVASSEAISQEKADK